MAGFPFRALPDQVSELIHEQTEIRNERIVGLARNWSMPVGLWRAANGFDTSYRSHGHASLSFVRSGGPVTRMDGRFRGRKGGAHPDSFMLYPGGEPRRYCASAPVSLCQIYFRLDFMADVFARDVGANPSGLELRDDRILTKDPPLRRMLDAYLDRATSVEFPPSSLEIDTCSLLLAIHILRHHSNRSAPPPAPRHGLPARRLKTAIDYLQANLSENVSLSRLGEIVGLSPRYLCTAFKMSVGETPHSYVMALRIDKSKRLLLEGGKLAEIALVCGFSSQQHFTSAFRRATKLPPGAWLKRAMD